MGQFPETLEVFKISHHEEHGVHLLTIAPAWESEAFRAATVAISEEAWNGLSQSFIQMRRSDEPELTRLCYVH